MDIKVRFRFNKATGEEELVVDAPGSRLGEAEHNARHEAVAAEIGRLLARFPQVIEQLPDEGLAARPGQEGPAPTGEGEAEGPAPRRGEERQSQ